MGEIDDLRRELQALASMPERLERLREDHNSLSAAVSILADKIAHINGADGPIAFLRKDVLIIKKDVEHLVEKADSEDAATDRRIAVVEAGQKEIITSIEALADDKEESTQALTFAEKHKDRINQVIVALIVLAGVILSAILSG